MLKLSAEELALLGGLIDANQAREWLPIPGRTIVSRPEKYAFPIGVDDAGEPFDIIWPDDEDDADDADAQ